MSTKYAGQVALNKLMQLVKNAIPTKVSQLTNDAGFITDADIPEGAAASTTAPLMDGTAAVGVSNAFARGDHVHPSDDSKLSLSGGTMTGNLDMGNKGIFNADVTSSKMFSILPAVTDEDVGTNLAAESKILDDAGNIVAQTIGFYGAVGDESVRITNVYDPENNLDAANKRYVDGKAPLIIPTMAHTYAEIEAAVAAGRCVIYFNEEPDGTATYAPLVALLSTSRRAVFSFQNGEKMTTVTVTPDGDSIAAITKTGAILTRSEVEVMIASAITGVYTPKGTVAFASLPTASAANLGWVYNISDAFTTTASFVEGAGYSYGAGTNVVCVDAGSGAYKWDVLAGTIDLTELTEAEVQTIWNSI